MQFLNDVKQKAVVLLQENATTLLTAGGVIGTVGVGVLSGRAGVKAGRILEREEQEIRTKRLTTDEDLYPDLDRMTKVKLVGPYFIPPTLLGGLTIASIIMSHRMSAQKITALVAAYGLAERNFEEYKEKVAEKLTGPKKTAIDDEIAQDRVNRTPGGDTILITGNEVLCFDEPTGRYFKSTMDAINKAVNATNAEIIHHDHASATYFYEELEMPGTTWTDDVGWNSDQLLELKISTVMTKDERPCIAIDFKTLPKPDYIPKHY